LIKKLHGNKIPKLSETWDGINEKTFRDLGYGFVVMQYGRKENLWMCL
jgi:hypothetical protein